MAFLATFPEVSTTAGCLHIRQDLVNHAVTIYLRDCEQWSIDTAQVRISPKLIHFVQPDGEIVGVKVKAFGGER